MSELIEIQQHDTIAEVALNRPEAYNSFNYKMISHRDREEPHSSPLPHHAAYGSVLRDSADQASSAPGERKPK